MIGYTGASISLLGKNCEDLIGKLRVDVEQLFANVKTAGAKVIMC